MTTKEREDGISTDGTFKFGVASMQGWRLRMEDAHLALPDFDTERRNGLFGVFDGHGGAAVAQVVAQRLPGLLLKNRSYKAGRYSDALSETFFRMDRVLDSARVRKEIIHKQSQYPASEDEDQESDEEENEEWKALFELFNNDDGESEDQLSDEEDQLSSSDLWLSGSGPDSQGTTAVVALICTKTQEVFVANAGDSRCALIRGDKAKNLSRDHKPMLRSEMRRIKQAGGFVAMPEDGGRVDGNLSLSRALGDFAYKKDETLSASEQKITCKPEVQYHKLEPSDHFIMFGCDGIWEKATSQQVATFLLPHCLPSCRALSKACAKFLDANLAKSPMAEGGHGCDNMTLMLVDLRKRSGAQFEVQTPNSYERERRCAKRTARHARINSPMSPSRRRLLVLKLVSVLACRHHPKSSRLRKIGKGSKPRGSGKVLKTARK